MDLNGTIAQPLQLQGVAAEVSVARLSPDQPSDSQGQAAPSQAPYRLVGQLTRQGDVWEVREIAGTLGKSDLAGTIRLDMRGKPPLVQAELSSHTLDVRDLTAFSGAPDQQLPPQAAETQSEDVPPEAVIGLELTRVVNARLHFQGQTVMLANQTLHNVSTDLALHDGHLSLRPAFDLAGGTIRAQIEVDARGDASLHSAIRAEIEQVNVQQVLATLGMEHKVAGTVHGQIDLAASGRSLTALTESLAGKATLTVKDQASNTDVQMNVATEVGARQAKSRLRIASQGRLYGEPFQLDGRVGAWRGGQQPASVQVQLRLGETRARLDGTLGQGSQRPGLAAQVTMQGPDPARLSALLPISIPSLPAYRVEGRLLQNGSTWTLKGLKATIGDSDLAGKLSLDTGGKHLVLRGDLHSQTFVVDELTGSRPEKKPGRVEPEKVRVPEEVKEEVQKKVQERPQAIEADLRFRGNKVIVTKIPLEQLTTDLRFHNGRLVATPTFHLAEGTIQAQAQVDMYTDPLQSTLRVKVHQINLQQFLTWLELTPEDAAKPKTAGQSKAPEKPAPPKKAEVPGKPEASGEPEVAKKPETAEKLGTAGKFDSQIDLTGAGSSLADFLASANGNVLLSMAEGQLGTVLTELVGLDVAQTIQKALSKDKVYQLRCLVADFTVQNGRMETQMLLVDTTDTKVIGGGFIDLKEKMVGLKLDPKAKDFSPFSVQSPLYITGPLENSLPAPS